MYVLDRLIRVKPGPKRVDLVKTRTRLFIKDFIKYLHPNSNQSFSGASGAVLDFRLFARLMFARSINWYLKRSLVQIGRPLWWSEWIVGRGPKSASYSAWLSTTKSYLGALIRSELSKSMTSTSIPLTRSLEPKFYRLNRHALKCVVSGKSMMTIFYKTYVEIRLNSFKTVSVDISRFISFISWFWKPVKFGLKKVKPKEGLFTNMI